MKVSVIIPVKEINDYIRESVRAISKLEFYSFEVLVLPDHHTGAELPGVRIIPTGPAGPAEKRDLSLKHATGEVLAFLDDDAYPRRDWLKNAVMRFNDPEVGAVGGPAITPRHDSILQRASGAVFSSRLASSSYTYRYQPGSCREVQDYPSVNFFVRRSVFEKLGGFDTEYWPGEDTKLCLDITKKLGLKIIYDPDVVVYHHRRPLFGPHLRQVSRYAFQRGYFAKKFPDTSLKFGYFVPSLFLVFVASGALASAFSRTALLVFASLMAVYIAALAGASIRAVVRDRDIPVGVFTFAGIFLTHLAYGFNFLKGLATRKGARGGERLRKVQEA